jgi:hypothetical protein
VRSKDFRECGHAGPGTMCASCVRAVATNDITSWSRTRKQFGIPAIVAGFWMLSTLPTGDSWTPHWIVSTVAWIVLVVGGLVAWVSTEEIKKLEREES